MSLVATISLIISIILALAAIALLILRHKSSLIFGKYPRKGCFYHLKYGIALLVLKRLRHKIYKTREEELNTQEYLTDLDKPQGLSDNPRSYDVVSFMGANAEGYKIMITLERRRRGILKSCLYVWIPGKQGLFCSPNLPDMVYFTTNGNLENFEFKGNNCYIFPEECMSRWRIQYDGLLRNVNNDNKLVKVKLDLQFKSTTEKKYFNYNRDLSASVIADSIARESWNDDFYKMLKNVDVVLGKRTHYEQNGVIEGELQIADEEVKVQLRGFRDHSFGTERCLSSINRYVYFALFLDDGTNMVVGILSQPSFFLSSLKVGYICSRDGVYQPITKCNFELYSYGEKGTPPQHQNFIVHTAKQKYFVQIKVEDSAVRYIGGDWESKVFNQFVSCTVSGIKGQGLTEYLYRNATGRPVDVSSKDPEWYQRIRNFERSLSKGEHDTNEVFFF